MRLDIEFDAEGVTLRGWLYRPDEATGPVPTVVMAHGFSAVKEMYLDSFAEAFAAGGLGALVFDNRNFGASDGEPRQEIDPWAQVRDYRHAITYATTLPEVDRDRIGCDAHPCYLAEAHLSARRGINAQRLEIGKILPDSRSTPDHDVEDLLLFEKVSDDQA